MRNWLQLQKITLLMPFFFARLGVKWMLLAGMGADRRSNLGPRRTLYFRLTDYLDGRRSDLPRLVRFEYTPDGATGFLAIVGKGIVFDSGGLSLKPPAAMETMILERSRQSLISCRTGTMIWGLMA